MIQFIAYALMAGLALGYVKGCTDEKHRFDDYKVAVKAVGQAQEQRTRERIALDIKRRNNANAENLKLRLDLAAESKRLRVERTRGSYVPPSPPGAKRPDIAPFNRAELDAAIRRLDEGVQGLIDQGDAARIDLDTAKRWAQE